MHTAVSAAWSNLNMKSEEVDASGGGKRQSKAISLTGGSCQAHSGNV